MLVYTMVSTRTFRLAVVLCLMDISSTLEYEDYDKLVKDLFNTTRYNPLIRPLTNQSHVIKINFTQYISSVTSFDTTSGELVTSGFFTVTWQDELIAWNPANYGGKTRLPVSQKTLWTPKIALSNSISNDEVFIDSSGLAPIFIDNTGVVEVYPSGTYRTRCILDITYYPFDKHLCEYYFIIANHDSSEILIDMHTDGISFESSWENGEWWVSQTETQGSDATSGYLNVAYAITSMTLKRRPNYELLNNIVPIAFLALLNLLACFVHPQSGERLSFSITLYLAFVVLTTSVLNGMPRSALQLPILSYLMCFINFANTAGIVWGIFIVHVAQSSPATLKLPRCCVVIARYFLGKNRPITFDEFNAESESTDVNGAIHGEDNQRQEKKQVKESDNGDTKQLGESAFDSHDLVHISRILDRIYFCVGFVIFAGINVIMVCLFASS